MSEENFVDSYNMNWTLEVSENARINESFSNISISDFEVIYGNNIYHIVSIDMRLSNAEI